MINTVCKFSVATAILFSCCLTLHAAGNPKELYTEIVHIATENSPYADQINWDELIEQGFNYIGDKNKLCVGTAAAAKFIFPALRNFDKHSFITTEGLGEEDCPLPPVSHDPKMEEWLDLPYSIRKPIIEYTQQFHGHRIGDVSYLYIPGGFAWEQSEINKIIAEGRKALADSDPKTSKGVIIDLRFNTGGNIVPMLLSISSLLPEGQLFKIGQDITINLSEGNNTLYSEYRGQREHYGHYDGNTIPNILDKPVVILVNGLTGSSGAITAYTLKTTGESRVLGEASSDSLSVTESFKLMDGNYANIMVQRIYDRDGNLAPLSVTPDTSIPEDYRKVFSRQDKTINAGVEWIIRFE